MSLDKSLFQSVKKAVETLYGQPVDDKLIQLQATRKDFEGDLTLVVFPFVKMSKKKPEETAAEIGDELLKIDSAVEKYNVIKGFLNISISKSNWVAQLNAMLADENYGTKKATPDAPLYMVEYSSPNTNKPLHLGHVRNNLLGYSLCKILEASK